MKKKHAGRKILSALLVLCMVISMLPTVVLATEGDADANAAATLQLQQQIDDAAAPGGSGVVTVAGDIYLTQPLVFPSGAEVRMVGNGDNYPTIAPATSFQGAALISIESGTAENNTRVSLDHLMIDGKQKYRGILLGGNAKLNLGGSAKEGEKYSEDRGTGFLSCFPH